MDNSAFRWITCGQKYQKTYCTNTVIHKLSTSYPQAPATFHVEHAVDPGGGEAVGPGIDPGINVSGGGEAVGPGAGPGGGGGDGSEAVGPGIDPGGADRGGADRGGADRGGSARGATARIGVRYHGPGRALCEEGQEGGRRGGAVNGVRRRRSIGVDPSKVKFPNIHRSKLARFLFRFHWTSVKNRANFDLVWYIP